MKKRDHHNPLKFKLGILKHSISSTVYNNENDSKNDKDNEKDGSKYDKDKEATKKRERSISFIIDKEPENLFE